MSNGLADALRDPTAYPHACVDIRLVETHISWVFLTGDFAYKLKKPVNFGFLDFSTLDRRQHFCEEECVCNARFAPDIYLGVVEIRLGVDGRYRIGGDGRIVDYAVKMRQFDDQRQLDHLLERGELDAGMLRRFATDLAAIYRDLPNIPDAANMGGAARVVEPVRENFRVLKDLKGSDEQADAIEKLLSWSMKTCVRLHDLFDERAAAGWIRERHGDLHLSNLVHIGDRVQAFDCIEFSRDLRCIDAVSDIAFLFMDCAVRGREDLAYAFVDGYLDASGDYNGMRLLGFYAVYRSLVRAKVAALRLAQTPDPQTAAKFQAHLTWARGRIERGPGRLILMSGVSGSGKSWLAERLTPLLPAIRIRSDIVRRLLAGLDRTESSGSSPDAGIYTPVVSETVYAELCGIAARLLEEGESVIVDATFLRTAQREIFQAMAAKHGLRCVVVSCDAPLETLERRVSERLAAGIDPSEATLTVLHRQLDTREPPEAGDRVVRVATDGVVDAAAIAAKIISV